MPIYKSYLYRIFYFPIILLQILFNHTAQRRIIKNTATMQSKAPSRLILKIVFDLLKLYDAIPVSLLSVSFSLFLNKNKAPIYSKAVKLPISIKL